MHPQRIERYPVLRLELAQKLDDLLPGIRLVCKFRVEPVPQDHGDAGGDAGATFEAVGKNVGLSGRRRLGEGVAGLHREKADLFFLAAVQKREVITSETRDRLPILVVNDHVHLHQPRRGSNDRLVLLRSRLRPWPAAVIASEIAASPSATRRQELLNVLICKSSASSLAQNQTGYQWKWA